MGKPSWSLHSTEHFQFLVMPFDLSNKLPWILISDVLWNMKNKFVFVSLDDILIIFPERKGTHSPSLCESGETYSSSDYKNNK